jgi:hypothetical protein
LNDEHQVPLPLKAGKELTIILEGPYSRPDLGDYIREGTPMIMKTKLVTTGGLRQHGTIKLCHEKLKKDQGEK